MAGAKKGRQITKTRPIPEPAATPATVSYVCTSCGSTYSKQKGIFPLTRCSTYSGSGYLHICNNCIDNMYNEYLAKYRDERLAIRRMCMKLDLYWSEDLFEAAKNKPNASSLHVSLIRVYLNKTNLAQFRDKNYDDTIEEEYKESYVDLQNLTDDFGHAKLITDAVSGLKVPVTEEDINKEEAVESLPLPEITQDEIEFWGPGYTKSMYAELEQRKRYWINELSKRDVDLDDVGAMALLRQICNLEIDINRDRVAGKSVDKSVNTLNTLIGSASLKPSQRKEDVDNEVWKTPLGVWNKRWEEMRPIPECPEELKDNSGIVKTILVWFFGHLCKMVGIKNSYSKLYEEEIERLRVEFPEYADEDDDAMLADIFGQSGEPDD